MIQNIKVDIIYYSVGSDFEMEFNLCGCCRMRMLTDKVEGQSEFSKSLARAVGRSRVIILCGPLFGDKGLIKTVSAVTGIKTEKLDISNYNIETDSDIEVLTGSTPLISEGGVFGGCIIESGTQSIIMLSESKSLRKDITKQLVFPYITKISVGDEDGFEKKEEPVKPQEDEKTATETVEELLKEAMNERTEESNDEKDVSDEGEKKLDENSFFVISSDSVSEDSDTTASEFNGVFDFDANDDGMSVEERNDSYYFEDYDETQNSGTNKYTVAIRVLIVFVILIALAILYLAVAKPLMAGNSIMSYLKDAFEMKAMTNFLI